MARNAQEEHTIAQESIPITSASLQSRIEIKKSEDWMNEWSFEDLDLGQAYFYFLFPNKVYF